MTLAIAAVVAGTLLAFGWRRGSSDAVDAGAAVALPAAPDDLLADVYVTSPDESWGRLQRGIGGAMGLLPMTLPGMLVTLTEHDVTLASELDGASPMFGVLSGDVADPRFALAIKLVDARRARNLFNEADAAAYEMQRNGMTPLVPKSGRGVKLATAMSSNGYLVFARDDEDLARLGPYAARALPARPLASSSIAVEIPKRALRTVLKPKLESLWKQGKAFLLEADRRMRAERGRAPDFGEPAAIVAALDAMLTRRLDVLADLESARVTVDVAADAVILSATLAPSSDGEGHARRWIETMSVGDAAPLLSLPATSAIALSNRDSEATRREQWQAWKDALISSMGARLEDPAKVSELFDAVTKASGDEVAVALGLDDPAGVFVHAPVRDPAEAERALRLAAESCKLQPFKELLGVRAVTSKSEEVADLGRVSIVNVARSPKPSPKQKGAAETPTNLGFAWALEEKVLSIGAGAEPIVTLKTSMKAERRLAEEPQIKRFVESIGRDATTALVVQPLRFDPKRANLQIASVGVALGRRGPDAFVNVDVSSAVLREIARWQLGF